MRLILGLGRISVVECIPSIFKALYSIPCITKTNKNQTDNCVNIFTVNVKKISYKIDEYNSIPPNLLKD